MTYGGKKMNRIGKLINSYRCNMNKIYDRELLPCCVVKVLTYLFFAISLYLFFIAGRQFEMGYYGEFAWYVIGGLIAYSIYFINLKQICWSKLKSNHLNYEDCKIHNKKLLCDSKNMVVGDDRELV